MTRKIWARESGSEERRPRPPQHHAGWNDPELIKRRYSAAKPPAAAQPDFSTELNELTRLKSEIDR
jgi:hypothetical protein